LIIKFKTQNVRLTEIYLAVISPATLFFFHFCYDIKVVCDSYLFCSPKPRLCKVALTIRTQTTTRW